MGRAMACVRAHVHALCQVVLLAHCVVAQRQPVWVSGSLSFTDANWPVGFSARAAADIMLEEINAHPFLLPGYELKVFWQDDKCDAIEGEIIFLRNVHEELYYPVLNGSLEKTTWNSSNVNPPPVGMIGMGCTGPTQRGGLVAQYVRMPMISGTTTSSILSNRTRYPNFFRTVIPDIPIGVGLLSMFLMLGMNEIVPVSGTSLEWAEAAVGFIVLMSAMGITPVGPPTDFAGFNGVLVPDTVGGTESGIALIKKQRTRLVGVVHNINTIRMMMCQTQKARMFNTIFATVSSLETNWWKVAPPMMADCTPELLFASAKYFLAGQMVSWRNDANQVLSCSTSMTSGQLRAEWFRRLGKPYGDMTALPEGFMSDNAASVADALCMFALAIRKLLVDPGGFTVAELAARNETVYRRFNEEFAAMQFQGVTGPVFFPPFPPSTQMALGDPGSLSMLSQLQGEGNDTREVNIVEWNMVFQTFKFLGNGNITFQFPGESTFAGPLGAGAVALAVAQFQKCTGVEKVLDYTTNTCGGCPSDNEVYVQASDLCVCKAGLSRAGDGPCIPCAPGKFAGTPGASECLECEVGKSTNGNLTSKECTNCEQGKYANETGMPVCTTCPELQTTLQINSKFLEDCVCETGAFNNSAGVSTGNDCVRCPNQAVTDGPGKVSIEDCKCGGNNYMPKDKLGCQACPDFMDCSAHGITLGNQANFPNLTRGYWSDAEDPLSIFRCSDVKRCPGWQPGLACGDTGLEGQACEKCIPGSKWTGDRCVPCDPAQSNKLLFPVLPLVMLPIVLLLLYKMFGDTITKWGSWQNTVAALCFVVLNHYQVLGILSRANIEYPRDLGRAIDVYMATNEVTAGFGLDCIGVVELFDLMLMKASIPAIVLAISVMMFLMSHALAVMVQKPSVGLERDRLFNVVGSLMFTFFGSIASMSMQLFKCKVNPNGLQTLAVDLSVVCGLNSPDWTAGLGVGISSVVVYVVGLGCIFIYAIAAAPKRFREAGFRMRWKFLFIKYHASAYWWGLMFLWKNFLINLAFVVSGRAESQLYMCLSVILCYILVLMEFFPFRATLPNVYELFIGACHIMVFSLSVWYVQKTTGVSSTDIEVAGLLVSVAPAAGVFWGVGYLVIYGKKTRTPEIVAAAEDNFEQLKSSYVNFAALTPEMGAHMVLSLDEGDLRVLQRAAFIINVDVFGAASNTRCAMDIRRWSVSPHRFTGVSSTALAARMSADMAIAQKEALGGREQEDDLTPPREQSLRIDSRDSVRVRTGGLTSV